MMDMEFGIAIKTIEEASNGSDAIVIMTEWEEFFNINWNYLYKIMRRPSWIFDTRYCINYKDAKKAGFNIWMFRKFFYKYLIINKRKIF